MNARSRARRMLLPFTPLYRLGIAIRDLRLRRGGGAVRRLRLPVVSIGNLSTGGAGKTPFAIALAKALSARGWQVDVLSRGYGRKARKAARVDPRGDVEDFGDEPILIARETGVPVYVAAQRLDAGLLAESDVMSPSMLMAPLPLTDSASPRRIHILDDGFQHRRLYRDIDILLIDRTDWCDRLLPAGNLREPLSAAQRAGVIVIPHNDLEMEQELRRRGCKGAVWRVRRHMEAPPVSRPVLAFCGIARPEQFFAGLESAGMSLAGRIAFRDHHDYTDTDVERLYNAARSSGAGALVTTAKDKVRLTSFLGDQSPELPVLTAGLRIEICDEDAALDWLASCLRDPSARPSL